MKNQQFYDDFLDEMPFEALQNWCNRHLSANQRKAIYRYNCRDKNYTKFKKCYLYDINGKFIDVFESREDAGDHIAVLCGKGETSTGYVSSCLRRKRPIYSQYWVTEEFPFNEEEYNNNKVVKYKKGGKHEVK